MTFRLAKADGVAMPLVEELPIDTGTYAGNAGALIVEAGGYAVQCADNPTIVLGVTLGPGGADSSGFSRTGRKEFPPGKIQYVRVNNQVQFRAKYKGSKPADVGGYYACDLTNGVWTVDFGTASSPSVRYVRDVEAELGFDGTDEVIVEFIPAVTVPQPSA